MVRLLLTTCLATPGPAPAVAAPTVSPPSEAGDVGDDALFERYEIATGGPESPQTVLPGFFLDSATAELAVVVGERGGSPSLRLYGFDGTGWAPVVDAPLGRRARFVDVATIAGRDRLLVYNGARFDWFDPETAKLRPLVAMITAFKDEADMAGVPRIRVAHDLNGDGRDDLVLPDLDGFWVSTQNGDGSFAAPLKLGPPEPLLDAAADERGGTYREMGISALTVPIYLRRLHRIDYDRDGRVDLVFWRGDHFEVHRQDELGRFQPAAESFETAVRFDSEGAYSRLLDYHDAGPLALIFGCKKKTRRTVLHTLADIDGDGVADLVTLTLSGRTILRQRSVYRIHFGAAATGGTVFAPEAGTTLRPRGIAGGMQAWGYARHRFDDLDGDGRLDAVFQDTVTGLGGMFRAMVGNTVAIDLELYKNRGGGFPDRPGARLRIRDFRPFAGLGNVFFPPVLVGDVDGDGNADLMVGKGPRRFDLFLGVAGPGLFEKRPRKLAVELPSDERHSRLVDLNRDGKQDLLIHLTPSSHRPKRPYRLTTLIAR